jgi:DNA repair protein RadC
LSRVKGIGRAKAAEIAAAIELGRRVSNLAPEKRDSVTCPRDVAELLMSEMRFLAKEHFRVLLLSTKNQVIRNELVSIGTLNASLVHPRELFRSAVQRSCASVILAHNHPSGDPTPSSEDISLTTRVAQAGKVLGIEVLDHIVIGDNTFVSLKEKGVL